MSRPSTIEGYEEELDAADALIQRQQERIERLEGALAIIAGHFQCIDNLMSDKDIAEAALAEGKQ